MTKPIRNTGPCFHLSLPRQRGQRDVLSHTEFINVHILHALSLPGHPLRVTRKPPTADWWVLLLALPEETSITINIVPCVRFWRRRFLKGFYHIWAWRPSLSCDQNILYKFWLTYHKESSYEI